MPNARSLALRDPASAALMGAIAGDNFGFGDDYGFDGNTPNPFPQIDLGFDYGFGAAPRRPMHFAPQHHPIHHVSPAHPAHPAHQAHAHAWAQSHMNPASTAARTLLLDPNRDSTVKVTRYSFSFSPAANLVLGTASAIQSFTQQPSTSIKGQRILCNAPTPGFVFLTTLQIANVNVFVGTTEDAYTYSAGAMNVILDLPRLDPQNRATAAGSYSGMLPAGFANGSAFTFVITIQGPSVLAGGYGQ